MPDVKLPYALDANDRMVAVEDVPRGDDCDCRCPACLAPLRSKKGDIISWHFAHQVEGDCPKAYETMVHKLAKQIILYATEITLPPVMAVHNFRNRLIQDKSIIQFTTPRAEVWLDDIDKRPDIMLQTSDGPLAVEIWVTHQCPAEKRQALAASDLKAVEINLSLFRDRLPLNFPAIVLHAAKREWLHHPLQVAADAEAAAVSRQAEADRQAPFLRKSELAVASAQSAVDVLAAVYRGDDAAAVMQRAHAALQAAIEAG
jgi:hypothetical protein